MLGVAALVHRDGGRCGWVGAGRHGGGGVVRFCGVVVIGVYDVAGTARRLRDHRDRRRARGAAGTGCSGLGAWTGVVGRDGGCDRDRDGDGRRESGDEAVFGVGIRVFIAVIVFETALGTFRTVSHEGVGNCSPLGHGWEHTILELFQLGDIFLQLLAASSAAGGTGEHLLS